MKNTTLALGLASALLAGCGGGGPTSTSPISTTPAAPTAAPVAPVSSPTTPATTTSTLATATINGNLTGFVSSASLPVYTFSTDTTNNATCTSDGGCINTWPAVIAPSGTLSAGFTSFTRSDNGEVQLEYNGKPLYTFLGDSADAATGIGDQLPASTGGMGTFELAQPVASAATPDPTASPAPAPGSPYSIHR